MDENEMIELFETELDKLTFICSSEYNGITSYLFQEKKNEIGTLQNEYWFLRNEAKEMIQFEFYGANRHKMKELILPLNSNRRRKDFIYFWEYLTKKENIRIRLLFG